MSSDAEFNPFAHTTGASDDSSDRRILEEMDELRQEPVAPEDEADPTELRDD